MEPTTINNTIKQVRDLFNELRSSPSREEITELEKNSTKKKLYIIF